MYKPTVEITNPINASKFQDDFSWKNTRPAKITTTDANVEDTLVVRLDVCNVTWNLI